jgi:hypothetical protein
MVVILFMAIRLPNRLFDFREPLIKSDWILATPSLSGQGVKLQSCLDLTKLHNAEMANLAKPLRAGLKAHFFVVVALDLRMLRPSRYA